MSKPTIPVRIKLNRNLYDRVREQADSAHVPIESHIATLIESNTSALIGTGFRRPNPDGWEDDCKPLHSLCPGIELLEFSESGQHAQRCFLSRTVRRQLEYSAALAALATARLPHPSTAVAEPDPKLKRICDAVPTGVLFESLSALGRYLPDGMVFYIAATEGIKAKSDDPGGNPTIPHGADFAKPDTSAYFRRFLEHLRNGRPVEFCQALRSSGIAARSIVIDPLEGTRRFSSGQPTATMVALAIFDQPMVLGAYEGYAGTLFLPPRTVEFAREAGIEITYLSSRKDVMRALRLAYPDAEFWVWMPNRESRVGQLIRDWEHEGAKVIKDLWYLPSCKHPVVTDGCTVSPTWAVGAHRIGQKTIVMVQDGYGATTESWLSGAVAIARGCSHHMALLTEDYKDQTHEQAARIMSGDAAELNKVPAERAEEFRRQILRARQANIPSGTFTFDRLFPQPRVRPFVLNAGVLADSCSDLDGVVEVARDTFRVEVRCAYGRGVVAKDSLTFRCQRGALEILQRQAQVVAARLQ